MYSFSYLEPVCCSMSSSNCCSCPHIGFSRGRSGGLVFPSLSECSTVYCDPHSQRLWHSQHSRNRCHLLKSHKISIKCDVLCLVTQSCLTLCKSMDCGPPYSSVHGDSPGKNTGMGCHAFLQEIFPTQGPNPGLPHCRRILYHLSHQESS